MSSKQILYFVTLLVVATLLVASFYWFEWRPTQIKKECHEYAQRTHEMQASYLNPDIDVNEWNQGVYEYCLREHGL